MRERKNSELRKIKITKNYLNRTFKNSKEAPMYSVFPDLQAAEEASGEDT